MKPQKDPAETVDPSEIADLEEIAEAGRKIPPGCSRYRIRIDREKFVVDVPEMTGRELLELAEKAPVERYRIDQKLRGGTTKKIELNEKADFRTPGVERFMTMRLDQTEG